MNYFVTGATGFTGKFLIEKLLQREGMFKEAGELSHPYFRTKHDSEEVVRRECKIPWRVYRPASVVGHSLTGEIDKTDGPYYSFPSLAKLRKALPPWFPLITVDMGSFNIVPVDYVVAAMDHIAHKPDCDYRAFHLTDPEHYSAGEMMNIFAEAAGAPRFALRLDTRIFSFIPSSMVSMLSKLPPVKRLLATAMESIGMPVNARRRIEEAGGEAHIYGCDIANMEACDTFLRQVIADHGRVDILINNAGRSIRRAVEHSYDRFHDFERTMQLNYFGCLRLSPGVLPGMSERRSGHIINISSMGVVGPPARFSAYIDSRSALEGWSRCAEAEFCDRNIHFTNINMPLVRTPMIGPTKVYDVAPALSPEQAADMVVDAVINKPSRIVTGMGRMFQIWRLLAPKLAATAMNIPLRMFGDSNAARGIKQAEQVEPSSEQVAIAALLKGVHY